MRSSSNSCQVSLYFVRQQAITIYQKVPSCCRPNEMAQLKRLEGSHFPLVKFSQSCGGNQMLGVSIFFMRWVRDALIAVL